MIRTHTPDPGGRFENLDVLRGCAALVLLLGHAYQLGGSQVPFVPEGIAHILARQTATAVWLFFALSGFLISRPFVERLVSGHEPLALVPYAARRGFRILPAYWVALTLTILAQGGGGAAAWHYPLHYLLLHNLVPGREIALLPLSWTLTLEMIFYICVPILAIALWRLRPNPITPRTLAGGVVVTWALSIVWAVGAATVAQPQTGRWLRTVFPAMWAFFCPGILLAIGAHTEPGTRLHKALHAFPRSNVGAAAGVALLIGATVLATAPTERWPVFRHLAVFHAAQLVFSVGYGLIVGRALSAAPWRIHVGSIANEIGFISYGIFLYQGVVLAVLLSPRGRALIPPFGTGPATYVVHVVVLVATTLPLAWLSWNFLERPLNDFARRRFATRAAAPADPGVLEASR